MIPQADIVAWRSVAPWITDAQVEQDLIITRALVSLFSDELLSASFAVRGGTILHKLFLSPAPRYSEDIDLVQVNPGPIGPLMDAIHNVLDGILGEPRRTQKHDSVSHVYQMESEIPPIVPLRLKVEINTREHFTVLGFEHKPLKIESRWFTGEAEIVTYSLDELLGTKLRALYQRRKGRDLFDIWLGLTIGGANPVTIVKTFRQYMNAGGFAVTQKQFKTNLAAKMENEEFLGDTVSLLRPEVKYDPREAYQAIERDVLSLL